MISNNTFNLARFGLLCKQSFIHQYKLFLTSVIGFCGALFMLLFIIQFLENFQPVLQKRFVTLLIISISVTGIIYAGTSFPAFRSREKTITYLMNPASVFEKFLIEFAGRILLFITIAPLLYWLVYNVEGWAVKLFYPHFSFESHMPFYFPDINIGPESIESIYALLISASMLIFVIPFTGAAVFVKSPLIKTLFAVAIIFFFNLFIAYFFMQILGIGKYEPNRETGVLFIRTPQDVITACIIGSLILNMGFILAAYFKLKEKEV